MSGIGTDLLEDSCKHVDQRWQEHGRRWLSAAMVCVSKNGPPIGGKYMCGKSAFFTVFTHFTPTGTPMQQLQMTYRVSFEALSSWGFPLYRGYESRYQNTALK